LNLAQPDRFLKSLGNHPGTGLMPPEQPRENTRVGQLDPDVGCPRKRFCCRVLTARECSTIAKYYAAKSTITYYRERE